MIIEKKLDRLILSLVCLYLIINSLIKAKKEIEITVKAYKTSAISINATKFKKQN